MQSKLNSMNRKRSVSRASCKFHKEEMAVFVSTTTHVSPFDGMKYRRINNTYHGVNTHWYEADSDHQRAYVDDWSIKFRGYRTTEF